MLNLGSKVLTSNQIFSISSNFWNHRWGTKTRAFPWPLCIVSVKIDWITILVPIILRINQWRLYHLKKCQMDNQIYILRLSTFLHFYKLLFKVKKIDVRLNKTLKLKFTLILFYSDYATRPSETVTKYTIYLLSYWWKDYSNGLGSYFATLLYGQQNLTQKCLEFYFLR